MIKRICDRCSKEIEGNYWTIDIYEHEDNKGTLTTRGAINNMKQNVDNIFKRQREYCKNCIQEIKDKIES